MEGKGEKKGRGKGIGKRNVKEKRIGREREKGKLKNGRVGKEIKFIHPCSYHKP